jgi:hypothetical protein
MNFTPLQVYEHVPSRYMVPDNVLIVGTFACPDGYRDGIPVELRITSPAAAAGTWTAVTVGAFTTFDAIAYVTFWLPLWRPTVCGDEITYDVRGKCGGAFTPWETFTAAVVGPRYDEHRQWIRKLDGDLHVPPPAYQPSKRWYPATLNQLLWCVRDHQSKLGPVSEARSTGSHWGISYAAVTPGAMFETATPVHEEQGDQTAARLNNVLYDVIPSCLTQEAWEHFIRQRVHAFNPSLTVIEEQNYLFHVEAGTRIYELYSYIDGDTDGQNARSLAAAIERQNASTFRPTDMFLPPPCYLGPWALETMGGAGGQTIVGAASTATHGGDVGSSAIGDLVVAMHLIAPDGQEYWIERTHIRPSTIPMKLIDETLLQRAYPVGDPRAPGGAQRRTNIIYKRDDDLMNAALVSCGRMGVIYSVVLRAIRQYAITQHTETSEWEDTKKWICNPADPKFTAVFANRFVRVDVELYPQPEFHWHTAAWTFGLMVLAGPVGALVGLLIGLKGDKYRTWHITRTMDPLQNAVRPGQSEPYGRLERGGDMAGKGPMLKADSSKGCFSDPCGSSNFIRQFLTESIGHLSDIRDDAIKTWLAAGAAMLFPPNAVWAVPLQAVCTRVIVFTEYWIIVFSEIRAILPDEAKFGDYLCAVLNAFGAMHAHSIVQLMYMLGQDSEHDKDLLVAISYAVMDEHNYQNKGCINPGDSLELFFDADKPDFISFVDFAIDGVRDLADDGKVWAGYVSMRFMTESPSFLAMQRWPRTVSMEIASLSKASGAEDLLTRIEGESRNRGIVAHWGQRNHREQKDVEMQFGSINKWRDALSELSEHGRLANFSTEFTKLKGLEITVPRLYVLTASLSDGCANELTKIAYDGWKNPPETKLALVQRFASGVVKSIDLPDLRPDTIDIPIGEGRSTLELQATRELNGNLYHATPLQTSLRGFRPGDLWQFEIVTEMRDVGGLQRWFAEINLWSAHISNMLRVSEVALDATAVPDWTMRNATTGDVSFAGLSAVQPLPMLPVFNTNWQFFSTAAATAIPPPTLKLSFKITC